MVANHGYSIEYLTDYVPRLYIQRLAQRRKLVWIHLALVVLVEIVEDVRHDLPFNVHGRALGIRIGLALLTEQQSQVIHRLGSEKQSPSSEIEENQTPYLLDVGHACFRVETCGPRGGVRVACCGGRVVSGVRGGRGSDLWVPFVCCCETVEQQNGNAVAPTPGNVLFFFPFLFLPAAFCFFLRLPSAARTETQIQFRRLGVFGFLSPP